MTNMRTLLTRAIRKTRQKPLGDTPEAEEIDAALEDAQAFFLTLTNRQLVDVLVSADYEAGEDERVNTGGLTLDITLPTSISGEDRPPRAGAIVEIAGTDLTRYIYVPELASWTAIGGLDLNSVQPFGPSMDDALTDMLAARFCDSVFQVDPSMTLVQLASQGRSEFLARFSPPINVTTDPGLLSQRLGCSFP